MKKVLCTLAALAAFFLFSSVALAATQYEYGDVGDITKNLSKSRCCARWKRSPGYGYLVSLNAKANLSSCWLMAPPGDSRGKGGFSPPGGFE